MKKIYWIPIILAVLLVWAYNKVRSFLDTAYPGKYTATDAFTVIFSPLGIKILNGTVKGVTP